MTGANRSGDLTAEEWGWPRRSIAAVRPFDLGTIPGASLDLPVADQFDFRF
jgi:hypothetical protein